MPLLSCDEMQREEMYLASMEVLEAMGVVDGKSKIIANVKGGKYQQIFRYGDVLTVQKMLQLNPGVL